MSKLIFEISISVYQQEPELFLRPYNSYNVRDNNAMKLFLSLLQKTRFDGTGVEEQLPPPPSPPQLKEAAQLDGVPRLNSVDRILHPDGIPHISENKVSVPK
jgi:hypothetical protein